MGTPAVHLHLCTSTASPLPVTPWLCPRPSPTRTTSSRRWTAAKSTCRGLAGASTAFSRRASVLRPGGNSGATVEGRRAHTSKKHTPRSFGAIVVPRFHCPPATPLPTLHESRPSKPSRVSQRHVRGSIARLIAVHSIAGNGWDAIGETFAKQSIGRFAI